MLTWGIIQFNIFQALTTIYPIYQLQSYLFLSAKINVIIHVPGIVLENSLS